MFSERRSFSHRLFVSASIALPLCLSACGGDGTSVANVPPPPVAPTPTPTPTPTPAIVTETTWLPSPATRQGRYEILGSLFTSSPGLPVSSRGVAPGEFSITTSAVANAPYNYTLNPPAGLLPGGLMSLTLAGDADSWDFTPEGAMHYDENVEGNWPQFLGQRLTGPSFSNDFTRGISDGRVPLAEGKTLLSTLNYDIGFSYVAMGEWSWRVVDLSGYETGDFGDLLFVAGERTPSSGIPASGIATYDARTLARPYAALGTPFSLTADFGQRVISTSFDQDYRYIAGSDSMDFYPGLGIHVSGSAPFSNSATFNIPLVGTANYSLSYPTNPVDTPPAQPVTGMMNGAFFGPNAEQVGGVFSISGSGGALQVNEAFVGKQH